MPFERLVEIASSVRTETMLLAISMISTITTNTPSRVEMIRQQHSELAQRLCTPKLAQRIELLIRSGRGDAIVHQEQLLLAARLAFLHGQPGSSEDSPLEPIGELLLGINDLFNYGQQATTLQEFIITLTSRHQAIALSGQPRYQLARYFDLLVTRSRKKPEATCDLDAAFMQQTSISLEEYMAFALLYLEPFFGARSVHDLQHLLDKMSVGAYWLLHESFRVADSKKGVQTFTKHVGALFQDYITDLLVRIYAAGQPERFFDETSILLASPRMRQAMRKGKPPQCCDGVLVSGNSLVLFEMMATLLSIRTLVEGNPATFQDEVGHKFQHKIEQLDHTFDGLAQQLLELSGLDRDAITHVYPVLVLLQPFPQHAATWNHVLKFAKKPGRYVFGDG